MIVLPEFSGKGINSLRGWFEEMRSKKGSKVTTLDSLAKLIEDQLKKASLTNGKRSTTALEIFNNENYKIAQLFWKNI